MGRTLRSARTLEPLIGAGVGLRRPVHRLERSEEREGGDGRADDLLDRVHRRGPIHPRVRHPVSVRVLVVKQLDHRRVRERDPAVIHAHGHRPGETGGGRQLEVDRRIAEHEPRRRGGPEERTLTRVTPGWVMLEKVTRTGLWPVSGLRGTAVIPPAS